jgi:predicted TIM-barrel fold metal-dependent hydrolase
MTSGTDIRAALDHPVIDADGHLQEVTPLFRDEVRAYAHEIAGPALAAKVDRTILTIDEWMSDHWMTMTEQARRDEWVPCPAWWAMPTDATDRATSYLPSLLDERLGELGIDFSILYPSLGLTLPHIADPDVRRVACHVYNVMNADLFFPFNRTMTPVAIIPSTDPDEAIAELEHAVVELGYKAIVIGHQRRPIPKVSREAPDLARFAPRLDTYGIDSEHDYDPFWRRCEELGVVVGLHASEQSWGSRRSHTRYSYNHIGAFAAANESLCKSIFMGGVTRRFPTLNFVFLEGGAAWAVSLFTDTAAHWEKRNGEAIERLDPANLDLDEFRRLIAKHGPARYQQAEQQVIDFLAKPGHRPAELDDWSACGIEKAEDIVGLFVERFYFGCEADDPLNCWAFNQAVNPFNARLNIVFGSDIGHWDVSDLSHVLGEAHELVDDGLMSDGDFRDFVFTNPSRLYTSNNPTFFEGTSCEDAVAS